MNKRAIFALCLGITSLGWLSSAQADPFAKVPVGTVITKANCQQYLDHFDVGWQHECTESAPQNSMPADLQIVIAPTQSYPIPHTYWDATEKYSKQVSLVPTGDGSYTLKGYVAGMPFPYNTLDRNDPLAGYKLMYDAYFQYQPAVMVGYGVHTLSIDRYGNRFEGKSYTMDYVVAANTDAAYPMVLPDSPGEDKGVYFTNYTEQLYPTQLQYIAGVEWDYMDPSKIPNNWAYIPSIRRVLELSQAARCAPFVAAVNFSYDDHSRIQLPPTWFKAQYLGTKQEITYVVPEDHFKAATDYRNWEIHYGVYPTAKIGGHWEARPWLQLAMQRTPAHAAGYCEAQHYDWLDQEQTMTIAYDDFDQNGKFWRGQYNYNPAKRVPGTNGYSFYSGVWAHINPDFQNFDNSNLLPPLDGFWYNQETPKQYVNFYRFGNPAGLNEITQ